MVLKAKSISFIVLITNASPCAGSQGSATREVNTEVQTKVEAQFFNSVTFELT